jgi:hypothetical protein
MLLWVGCIAGALRDDEYKSKITAAGFQSITIEPTRICAVEDAKEFLSGKGVDVDASPSSRGQVHERIRSRSEAYSYCR